MAKKKTTRRSHDEVMALIEKAKEAIKGGARVDATLTELGIEKSVWYKNKDKRKTYERKTPTVSEISPVALQGHGGKTILVITDDKDLIASILERHA